MLGDETMDNKLKLDELIQARNTLASKEKQLYLSAVEKINISLKDLLKNDFGTILVKNVGRDLAGEIARRYFDFGDYYITVDQLYDRFVHFSYDSEVDILINDQGIKKAIYNYSDGLNSSILRNIATRCDGAQKQLFNENRAQDSLDAKGKKSYRERRTTDDGKLYDELTGLEGSSKTIIKNGKEVKVSDLQADHVQAREAIKYNERYIRKDKVE